MWTHPIFEIADPNKLLGREWPGRCVAPTGVLNMYQLILLYLGDGVVGRLLVGARGVGAHRERQAAVATTGTADPGSQSATHPLRCQGLHRTLHLPGDPPTRGRPHCHPKIPVTLLPCVGSQEPNSGPPIYSAPPRFAHLPFRAGEDGELWGGRN